MDGSAGIKETATKPTKARLSRHDWVLAGFRALVRAGPDAIRVEAIARDLGATKGSFYWHFTDLRDLQLAMLAAWEGLASTDITDAVRKPGLSARDQVMLLVEMVSDIPQAEAGGMALEPAVRDWARVDPKARAVMERVDAHRLAALRSFLGAAGLDYMQAAEGAVRFYAAVIGLEALRITCGIDMQVPLRAVAVAVLGDHR